jgi:hypothetical protein
MRRLCALLLTALVGAGCSAGFDPSSYLKPGQLRVLGVVADPPEVAAGKTSQLTVVAPPLSDGTPITYQWAICTKPPPPGTADVADDCLKDDTASFLIPIDGSGPSAMVTMPTDAGLSTLGVPDVSGGLYLPVRIRAFAGAQRVDTIYGLRLTLTLPGAPTLPVNSNPVIAAAELVDAPLDASPVDVTELSTDPANPTPLIAGSEPVLRLLLTPDSYETFPELTGTPPNTQITAVTEEPRFLWYASAGDLSEDTTGMAQPDTKLRLDKNRAPSPGDKIDLWVVVHDDRSGTAFTERFLVVQ